jgi:hypothetical protein
MDEFRFENTVKLTESQYVAVFGVLPRLSSRKMRLALLGAAGILLLFTRYTLLIGLILLGLLVLTAFTPRIISFGSRSLFRKHLYLRDALTYGVSDQKLWVKGSKIDASVSWSMLVTWREIEGWLVLSPSGIPPVLLSLARLNEEGLYGRVRALAASHAPEFNKSAQVSK